MTKNVVLWNAGECLLVECGGRIDCGIRRMAQLWNEDSCIFMLSISGQTECNMLFRVVIFNQERSLVTPEPCVQYRHEQVAQLKAENVGLTSQIHDLNQKYC